MSDAEVADFVRGERGRLIPKINAEKPAEPKAKLEEELVRTIVLKTAESVQEIVISESIEIVESWRDELLADMSAAERPSLSELVGDLDRRLEGESNE